MASSGDGDGDGDDEVGYSLSFRLNYIEALSPEPLEFDPELHVYLSAEWAEPRMARLRFDDSADANVAAVRARNRAVAPLPATAADVYHRVAKTPAVAAAAVATHYSNSGAGAIPPQWYAEQNLRGPLRFDLGTGGYHGERLPRDTTLNVDAFAYTYNSKGVLCLAEAGSCSLYLRDVYDELAAAAAAVAQPRQEPAPATIGTTAHGTERLVVQKVLKVHNADGLVKGAVVFVFDRDFIAPVQRYGDENAVDAAIGAIAQTRGAVVRAAKLDDATAARIEAAAYAWRHAGCAATRERLVTAFGATHGERQRVAGAIAARVAVGGGDFGDIRGRRLVDEQRVFEPPSVLDYRGENKRLYEACFRRYILANYEVFAEANARPTWPFMLNIHSPMYRFRGITVPGLCFTLLNNARAANTEAYYVNLLHITLRRHYVDGDAATASAAELERRFVTEATDAETAVVLAKLACIFSNYCTYMTDKAHTLADAHTTALRTHLGADQLAFVGQQQQQQHRKQQAVGGRGDAVAAAAATRIARAVCGVGDDGTGGGGGARRVAVGLDGTEAYTDPEYYEALRRIGAAAAASPTEGASRRREASIAVQRAARLNAPANVRLIESFSVWLRATFTGDCEDMAREIMRHLWDIRTREFESAALRKLQRVRRRYMALQTLKGVTSAALTDNLDEVSDMGAHMDITLVHTPYLLELMRAFNSHEPLLDELDEAYTDGGGGSPLPTLVCEGTGCLQPDGAPDAAGVERMYVMSTPRRDSAMRAFDNVKSMLHQPLASSSSFYKTVQSALVHDFIADGYPIGEIVFLRRPDKQRAYGGGGGGGGGGGATLQRRRYAGRQAAGTAAALAASASAAPRHSVQSPLPRRDGNDDGDDEDGTGHIHMAGAAEQFAGAGALHNVAPPPPPLPIGADSGAAAAGRPTYGIEHTKLIGRDTRDIMVYTMPDLQLDELRRFERVLRQNHPVLPLDRSSRATAANWRRERDGNVHLELVCAAARANARQWTAASSSADAAAYAYVDWYFTYAQVTAERARALCEVIASRPHVVRVDYYNEPICDDADDALFGGYLVRLVCHRLRVA